MAFLTVFSKIFLRRRKFCQNRRKTVLWESSKNQFGRPKKKKKVVKIFRKSAPPRENPRSAPVTDYDNLKYFKFKDDYLRYLILHEKQKKKHPNTKFLHIFQMVGGMKLD